MLHAARLKTALAKVGRIAVQGPWWRAVGFRHLLGAPGGQTGMPQPLWGGAAALRGARFTPRGKFDAVYLACDPTTALLEVQMLVAIPGSVIPLRSAPWTLVTVDGRVSNVLDLTDPATLKTLHTNVQEMTGPWVTTANPPTQELALAAYRARKFAGIKYDSAKHPGGINLVVFSSRLKAPSTDHLEVYDPFGDLKQRIGA